MPTRTQKAANRRTRYDLGPFKGVRTTRDPYDDPPDLLYDLVNGYIPDMPGRSGVYGRPGFVLSNGGNPLHAFGRPDRGQAIYTHEMLDGTAYNFVVFGGFLYRADASLTTWENVTPAFVTIDPSPSTRVSFVSLNGQLVVSDGVNTPWYAVDASASPLVNVFISYDGSGNGWISRKPFLYGGAIFFPLISVNGVSRGTDVSWLEPGSVSVGLQQPDYDNNWTMTTSNATTIFGGVGTNNAFYIFRALSIGSASGTVGPDLQSSATEDSVSFNVGTMAPQAIQQFGDSFFFCDAIGRPYMFTPGSAPVPIWEQMREIVDTSTVAFQSTTAITATSAIEPTLNLWVVAIWSPNPSLQASPTEAYVFDAKSGTYLGRWIIGDGVSIDCIGTAQDNSGRVALIVLGSLLEGDEQRGYVWVMNSLSAIPQYITIEDGTTLLTTEDGRPLTTEGQFAIWQDNGAVPLIKAVTPHIGFDSDTNLMVDLATVITGTDAPIRVSIGSSAMVETTEGTPEPVLSHDDTFRYVVGCEAFGRGPQITVQPLAADEQWSLQSVSMVAVPSAAGWDDP